MLLTVVVADVVADARPLDCCECLLCSAGTANHDPCRPQIQNAICGIRMAFRGGAVMATTRRCECQPAAAGCHPPGLTNHMGRSKIYVRL